MATPPKATDQSTFVTALPTQTQVETGQPVTAGFWMTDHDYGRLKSRVQEIENPSQWPIHVGAALAALIPAVILQLIVWLSTFPSLPTAEQLRWGWVSGVMVTAIIACVLGIVLCVFAALGSQGRRPRDKAGVLEDMEQTEGAARGHGAAGGGASGKSVGDGS
jgi:hypothetical protein